MQYMPDSVREGYSRKADIFEYPKMNTGTLYEEYIPLYPTSSLSTGGTIFFKIPGASGGYISGDEISMSVTLKITKANGDAVTPSDDVTLANQPLSSIFKMITCSLNSTYVNSEVGANYAYKRYFDTMINDNNIHSSGIDELKGFIPDGETLLDKCSAIAAENNPVNEGVVMRHELTKSGQELTLKGKLGIDFLEVNKFIVSGIDVNLEFYQNTDSFRLLSNNNNNNFKVDIVSMFLTVKYIKLRPEILMAHTERFDSSSNNEAHYPYNKTSMRVFTIPKGVMGFEQTAISGDKIPNKIIIGFVKNDAYAGTYSSNPFFFEHLSTIFASFEVDGRSVPHTPLAPDFNKNKFTECYYSMINGMKRPELCTISPNDFKEGRTLFVFNIANSDMEDVFPVLKRGSTRLCFKFSKALPYSISAIIQMIGVGEYVVTKSRTVRVEY